MSTALADPVDAALLGALQESIPMSRRPFAEIGRPLGLEEEDVLERIRRLKEEKIIRQISAIFDTRSLGYASSLVAAKVPEDRVEAAAAALNSHPGVSHNYLRNHAFNIWYTIAVPPTSRLGLEGTIDVLHRVSGAESTRLLPTLKLHKIGVRFDMGGESAPAATSGKFFSETDRGEARPLEPIEREFVRLMQRDLEIIPDPFDPIAEELGVPFDRLAEIHAAFLTTGRVRRFAAVLHHRRAGFRANAMGVWAGPADNQAERDRLGGIMAGFRAVSHCYERPSYPDWPYNLFTMVHGKSTEECEATLDAIAEATGLTERLALYSSVEFKKTRVRYFTGDEERWEEENAG
jgi:DNA-binding Lrp family transcriptional regulator